MNGLIEAATGSPIYVTSVPVQSKELSSSQAALSQTTATGIGREALTTTIATSLEPCLSLSSRRDSDTAVPSPTVPPAGKQVPSNSRRQSVDALPSGPSPVLTNGLKQFQAGTSTAAGKEHLNKSEAPGSSSVFLESGNGKVNGQYSGTNAIFLDKHKTSPKLPIGEEETLT